MPNKPKTTAVTQQRRLAEHRLKEQQRGAAPPLTAADTQRLIHELQVHQIELEMQNEELRDARDAMEAGLEKYSDLYDFSPVGYVTLDQDGTIREANLTSASLLGVERAHMLKRRFGFYVTPADQATFADFHQRVFTGKGAEACEVRLLKAGQPPVEVRMEARLAASGQECRAVVTDITERKRAELDRLILSKLESTGILAGGLAHDFNNLLTVVLLNLELARDLGAPGAELARLLEEAMNTSLAARELTLQLITFAKGGAPIRKPARLAGVIQESARSALKGSPLQCEFGLAEDLWVAEVDEGQIGQVIRNVVLNAREAMPQGGLISVRAKNLVVGPGEIPVLSAGEYVQVSIADQGPGIATEVLPKIFDPYFSTKQRGEQKGMGLGLTICHSVVQQHAGAIAVASPAGGGTTFHIRLPANRRLRIP
jgi:two-component system cell cycle sensor histidine kinase/response regulator CckA